MTRRISKGVIELASYIGFGIRLNERQTAELAYILQDRVDTGQLEGKIVTGDSMEHGQIKVQWEDL
jgi:hypothetical protein